MQYNFTYRRFATALYYALQEDAFYLCMERSVADGSGKEAMLRYLDYSMVEAEKYGELFIPQYHHYGVSIWAKPLDKVLESEKQEAKKRFLQKQMGENSLKTYQTIVDYMSEKSAPLLDESYCYLSIIGILPEFQGQGLGGELVSKVLEKTDRHGVPTYLETFTPRNMTFYQRFGYQAIESCFEPTCNSTYWLMTRPAAT